MTPTRLTSQAGRRHFGDALLRDAVGAIAVGRLCPRCGSSEHGRPWVRVAEGEPPWVSLAYAGDLVVAAWSWRAPVGVDVEPVDADAGAYGDAAAWTRAEAVLKATGEGLAHDPPTCRRAGPHRSTSRRGTSATWPWAQLKNSAVTGQKVKNGSVTGKELARGSVLSKHVSKQLRGVLDGRTRKQVEAQTPIFFRGGNATVQQVSSTSTSIGTIPLGPAGSYLVQVTLRGFPRTSNPASSVNCGVVGFGGNTSVSTNNAGVAGSGGVTYVTFSDVVGPTPANAVGTINCNAPNTTGEVSLSYEWWAVRVQPAEN